MKAREFLEQMVLEDDVGGKTSEERINHLRFAVTNALALSLEEEGFTREHVATLREVARDTLYETSDDERDDLRDIADLIEARLPPEGK